LKKLSLSNIISNKKIKNKLITLAVIAGIILYFYATYWVGSGLSQNYNVGLTDFTVSEDGKQITIKVVDMNSAGYIRSCNPIDLENVIYVDFTYTFGGYNSTIGAKDEFTLDITDAVDGIFFAREDGYELVLYDNPETGQWEKIVPKSTETE